MEPFSLKGIKQLGADPVILEWPKVGNEYCYEIEEATLHASYMILSYISQMRSYNTVLMFTDNTAVVQMLPLAQFTQLQTDSGLKFYLRSFLLPDKDCFPLLLVSMLS